VWQFTFNKVPKFSEARNVLNDVRTFSSNEDSWQVAVTRNLRVLSFKTKEFEWVLLQHSNTKPCLFTGIMERERSQHHLMKPESK